MSKASGNVRADTAVKLVLIFFISLLSFSVGTYVGKQVSDSDHRRAALEAEYEGESIATETGHNEAPATEATKPISEEEVASLTEEFVAAEREVASTDGAAAEKPAEKIAEKPTAHSDAGYTHVSKLNAQKAEEASAEMAATTTPTAAPKAEPKAEPKVAVKAEPKASATASAPVATETPVAPSATRVASDMAPSPDPKKKREPTAVLPSVATSAVGKYTVQVASYGTEDEAKDQAQKLKEKGYSAFYVPADVKGRTWYRVSVGLFSDLKSATNYRTELLAQQAVTSAIVQKITQ